jgi:nucleotide-binding universal stress UspA family protein
MSWPAGRPRRILAAVDGSATSLQAAEAAIALATADGAEVLLLHVLDDELLREITSLIEHPPEAVRERLQSQGEQILGDLCERASQRGVACDRRIEIGDPPRVIDEVARDSGADAIFVGKVGIHGVRRWLVGSVTRRLIEISRVPVVVITGPPEPR